MARVFSRYSTYVSATIPDPILTRSLYSDPLTAHPSYLDSDFPSEIRIDRMWSGVKIEWPTIGLGFSYVKIIRKKRDYAYTLFDGLVVYEGTATTGVFQDTSATGLDTYYYTLWWRNHAGEPWQTRYWTKAWEIALAPNDVPELLWTLLPTMYHLNEEERDDSQDLNLHVNRVIAPVVREIEDLTDFFPTVLDVDETPGPNLESIAKYVGLVPNLELTYTQQREEIKAAVESYKKKGLRFTLERMARAISGLEAKVVDWNQHLLITNWKGKTRPIMTPLAGFNNLLPGDTGYRRLDITGGKQFDTGTYGVYLMVPTTRRVGERTVRKLYRALDDFDPIYMDEDLWIISEVARDTWGSSILETSWFNVDESSNEDFSPQNLLRRNVLGKTTNTLGIVKLEAWPADAGAEEVS